MTNARPLAPSPDLEDTISLGVQAARAASAKEATQNTLDEILEITEDFASYVALRARGITVATRERRKLRTDIERVIVDYINGTATARPLQEELRPAARVKAIAAQHQESEEPVNDQTQSG